MPIAPTFGFHFRIFLYSIFNIKLLRTITIVRFAKEVIMYRDMIEKAKQSLEKARRKEDVYWTRFWEEEVIRAEQDQRDYEERMQILSGKKRGILMKNELQSTMAAASYKFRVEELLEIPNEDYRRGVRDTLAAIAAYNEDVTA